MKSIKPTALYVGRFQPFHLGHLDAVQQILADGFENIIIAIGSAENELSSENPFTASERFLMIDMALSEALIPREKYFIVPVRDINDYARWTTHLKRLLPPFQKVYSGSDIVQKLFSAEKEIEVFPLEKRLDIDATLVRKRILNEKNLDNFVPKGVQKYLEKIGARERLLKQGL